MQHLKKSEIELLSQSEQNRFKKLISGDANALNEKELKNKITATRRDRTKYQDLVKRQRSAAKKNKVPGGRSYVVAARTMEKVQIFKKLLAAAQEQLKSIKTPRPSKKISSEIVAVNDSISSSPKKQGRKVRLVEKKSQNPLHQNQKLKKHSRSNSKARETQT